MQVFENAAGNASFYRYKSEETYTALQALFMDCGTVESRGKWTRFWCTILARSVMASIDAVSNEACFSTGDTLYEKHYQRAVSTALYQDFHCAG